MSLFDEADEDMYVTFSSLPDSITRSDQSKLRRDCLRRENNRCGISGMINIDAITAEEAETAQAMLLDCSYIILFSLGKYATKTVRLCIALEEVFRAKYSRNAYM